jgi:hypothetical protein
MNPTFSRNGEDVVDTGKGYGKEDILMTRQIIT